jgi:hypothetical protein
LIIDSANSIPWLGFPVTCDLRSNEGFEVRRSSEISQPLLPMGRKTPTCSDLSFRVPPDDGVLSASYTCEGRWSSKQTAAPAEGCSRSVHAGSYSARPESLHSISRSICLGSFFNTIAARR